MTIEQLPLLIVCEEQPAIRNQYCISELLNNKLRFVAYDRSLEISHA